MKSLSRIAQFYSMSGTPCLERLIVKLVLLQKHLDAEARIVAKQQAQQQMPIPIPEPEQQVLPPRREQMFFVVSLQQILTWFYAEPCEGK